MINPISFVTGLRLLSIMVVVSTQAAPATADSIQLRSKVVVTDAVVRLGDVATLTGDSVLALADTTVVKLDDSQSSATLTQQSVRKALTNLNVNWALVSLKGFDECQILRELKEPENKQKDISPAIVAPASPIRANPEGEVSADSQDTIRARLIAWIRAQHGSQGDALRIQFLERDAQVLAGVAGQDLFAFTTSSTTHLGRVPVTIERFHEEKLVETQRVMLEVSQRHLAVVVVRNLNRGHTLAFEDVEIREMYCDRPESKLITKLDEAIGLVASAQLREGSLLRSNDIQAALLVRRNESIRVQAMAGGVKVVTLARALEDGSEGQMIQVRNERSRETFMVRVAGMRLGLLVLDAPESPVADNEKTVNTKQKTDQTQGSK